MKKDKTKQQTRTESIRKRQPIAERGAALEKALQAIVEGTASATGDEFFRSFVRHLATALQCSFTFIAELVDPAGTRARTISLWMGDHYAENFAYTMAGTPCEKVVNGKPGFFPKGVRELFPDDQWLAEIGAESYLGIPFFDSSGRIIGHLGALDEKPMKEEIFTSSNLKIFATRAGAELERKRAEEALRLLSGRLLKLQDEERRRIARELHDTTAQGLSALLMNLGAVRTAHPNLNQKARHALSESLSLAKQCLREIRSLSYLLHPPELEEFGLVSAIRQYTVGLEERSGIHVDTDLPPEIDQVRPEVAIALFRIVQESLANIHYHSRSRKAKIEASCDSNGITLRIKDRGRGMDFKAPGSAEKGILSLGVGIAGMRERLLQLGGKLEIHSSRRGTTLTATIPSSKAN